MEDDSWLEDVRRDAGACPSCGASAARPVRYGMPAADDFERLRGKVEFAGCCLPEVLHLYSCGVCATTYGERGAMGHDEPSR